MTHRSLLVAAALALMPAVVTAQDARCPALLSDYGAEAQRLDPGFTVFSAARGEVLFRTPWGGGDMRTPSCTACHTADPRQTGRNAKTGRPIDPVAVSINPRRFTDKVEVEKQFARDCRSVLGRECTPLERGDYITFMAGQ